MSGSPPSIHRNWGIDCLRGLAILLVLLNHLGLGFRLPLKKSLLIEFLPQRLLSAWCFNGYEAVFLFFVISGFVISMRVLAQQGRLQALDWRAFYRRRAVRILPLLWLLLTILSCLHLAGFADYQIKAPGQSLGGALLSAVGLYLNWYEGQTTWLPASWDVLWSLSIEEVFYLIFPWLCLWTPQRYLPWLLLALALSVPWTKGALDGRDIWQEKAYLPGMGAIAAGVLSALIAQRLHHLPPSTWRWLVILGTTALMAVMGWGDVLWQSLEHFYMWVLIGASAILVVASHHLCQGPQAPRGLGWLAFMGRLSYEIYLSHMFVVLSAVALFRYYWAPDLRWDFLVYPPAIVLSVGMGYLLQRWLTLPIERLWSRLA